MIGAATKELLIEKRKVLLEQKVIEKWKQCNVYAKSNFCSLYLLLTFPGPEEQILCREPKIFWGPK